MSGYPSSRPQRGLTLVELLVSLVIASFIVIAVTSFYVSSSRIRATQDAAGQLQDTARYVTDLMTRNIQQAGFQNYLWSISPGTSGASQRREVSPPSDGQPDIRGYNNSAAGSDVDHGQHNRSTDRVNNSDTLVLRYQGMSSTTTTVTGTVTVTTVQADGSMIDCLGRPEAAPTATQDRSYSVFEVRLNGAEPELRCKYKDRTSNTFVSEPVARGVETLQIMYGVDTNNDSFPDRWRNAAEVDGDNQWKNVCSVRVGMVLRSADRVASASTATSFKPLGDNFTQASGTDPGATFTVSDDGRLRRVVTFTVNVRNSLP